MKAFQHSFAPSGFSAFSHLQQTNSRSSDRLGGSESSQSAEAGASQESQGLEDLPGMGLGRALHQSGGGFDPSERSAGVVDVMEERRRRLQEDDWGTRMLAGGVAQTSGQAPLARTTSTQVSRLEAYRERFQSRSISDTAGVASSRTAFERRLEERLDALMELHGVKSVQEVETTAPRLPTSPWDVVAQRSEQAETLGFHNHNYSTRTRPGDLPRVGF